MEKREPVYFCILTSYFCIFLNALALAANQHVRQRVRELPGLRERGIRSVPLGMIG